MLLWDNIIYLQKFPGRNAQLFSHSSNYGCSFVLFGGVGRKEWVSSIPAWKRIELLNVLQWYIAIQNMVVLPPLLHKEVFKKCTKHHKHTAIQQFLLLLLFLTDRLTGIDRRSNVLCVKEWIHYLCTNNSVMFLYLRHSSGTPTQ